MFLIDLSPHLQFREMLLTLDNLTSLRFHLLISLRNQRNFCKSESVIFLLCLSESMEVEVKKIKYSSPTSYDYRRTDYKGQHFLFYYLLIFIVESMSPF